MNNSDVKREPIGKTDPRTGVGSDSGSAVHLGISEEGEAYFRVVDHLTNNVINNIYLM